MSGPYQREGGPIRSFGRIKGRPLRAQRAALIDTMLPRIALPDPRDVPIDPAAIMPEAAQVWLEIGFGGGEHMAAQAAANPETLVLGAEPFWDGAASALRHVDEQGLANVRLHVGDARDLLAALPETALDRIFIMFPDPWPKLRHHKRRLIQPDTVEALARVLKPGGALRFATDWADYADWTLERMAASSAFQWNAERADDWRVPPVDHVTTRYETKKLGDIAPVFLDFKRL